MSVRSGSPIGHYVVLREIGRGGTATVYEARHRDLGRRVAIKLMHGNLAADPAASRRFLREGKAAIAVRGPHVVDVFDVGTFEGVPYLVMELLTGSSLAAVLRARGRLPLRELVELMLPIASAVNAAHRVGVVHRDLKPSNVLLAERGVDGPSPVILDFGISRVETDIDRDLTRSEALLGTVHYLSPEQTRGGRNASARSDQYALGVMLYECATGARPFRGSTHYALMHAIVSSRPVPPSALDPGVPGGFDQVVLRAMHRDPEKRFASVRDLGAALMPWASGSAQHRWRGEFGAPPARAEPPLQRRWVVAAAVATLLAVATATLVGSRERSAARAAPRDATAAPAPSAVETLSSAARASRVPEKRAEAPAHAEIAGASPGDPGEGGASPSSRAVLPTIERPPSKAPGVAARRPALAASAERGTNGALIVE